MRLKYKHGSSGNCRLIPDPLSEVWLGDCPRLTDLGSEMIVISNTWPGPAMVQVKKREKI